MVAVKLPTFQGMVPAVDPHLLSDVNASEVVNAYLYSGALDGLPKKAQLYSLLNSAAAVAFRIPLNEADPTYLYDSFWLEFENPLTDFVAAPVSGDQYKRYYWTSPSSEPMYNTAERIKLGQPAFRLGIPQPANITVVASGGVSASLVSRAYLCTYVSEYGEEGPASNPVLVNGKADDTFAVTVPAVPIDYRGGSRNVKKIRIYRTITSAQGTATYYLVTELTATGAIQIFNDTLIDTVLASKPILESTAWTEPPDLNGFVAMPNGIIAGFRANELWFSEAYRPHAWPAAYSLTVEDDIVGLGVINQTLVVCTKGNPYTASGVNPASITTSKLAGYEPCLSKGSIVSTENGVYYVSNNGLILVNPGMAENITKQFISRDKWLEILNGGRVNAARFGSAYYCYNASVPAVADTAFQADMMQTANTVGSALGFMLDPTNANVGFVYLRETADIKTVVNDMFSGETLMVRSGKIMWLDQRPGYKIEPFKWVSKIFQTPDLKNFAAFKLYFYDRTDIDTPNPQNYSLGQVFNAATQKVIVRIFADGKLILAHEIRESGELHRMPSGFKAEFWKVEIEGQVKTKSFQMATSVKELSIV